MRLMFVYWRTGDAGSAQTLYGYAKAAEAMGHEVLLYAPEEPFPVKCSLNLESADAVIFILEWNMYLHPGELPKNTVRPARPGLMGIGHLNLVRLMNRVPRERRIVIDDDGMYNPITSVEGDFNHTSEEACRLRMETYESLSDKIYQPTLHPVLPNVGSFLFHAYNPALEVPLDFSAKELGMIYVGSNWFRWRPMMRVLKALEQVRARVGRVCIVGRDWDRVPDWVESPLRDQAYFTDPGVPAQARYRPPAADTRAARHRHDEPSGLQPGRGQADFPPLRAHQPEDVRDAGSEHDSALRTQSSVCRRDLRRSRQRARPR